MSVEGRAVAISTVRWHQSKASFGAVGTHRDKRVKEEVLAKYEGFCPTTEELCERRRRHWEKYWEQGGARIVIDV